MLQHKQKTPQYITEDNKQKTAEQKKGAVRHHLRDFYTCETGEHQQVAQLRV